VEEYRLVLTEMGERDVDDVTRSGEPRLGASHRAISLPLFGI
jgi:hypothetical protein